MKNLGAGVCTDEEVDVLYIHPSKFTGRALYCRFPLSVVALMNLLKSKGYKVKGINYCLERFLNKRFDLRKYLKGKKYHLVVIDIQWYEHIFGAISLAGICKEVNPQSMIVAGGLTASAFSAEILKETESIDFIIRGDAEVPLVELAEAIFKGGGYFQIPNLSYRLEGHLEENSLTYVAENIDDLNFVDLDFLENKEAYLRLRDHALGKMGLEGMPSYFLYLGRGCPYNCSFCGGSKVSYEVVSSRKKLLRRSPPAVIRDVDYLRRAGVKKFHLNLDLELWGKEFWSTFFEELRKRGNKIGLFADSWQLPGEDFIREFSRSVDKSYSQILITPSSGSEEVRRLNGKNFSNEEFFASIELLKEEQIPLEVYFAPFLPQETSKTFKETNWMAKEIRRVYPSSLLEIFSYPCIVDPKSPLFLSPERYGQVLKKRVFMDYYKYSRDKDYGWVWKVDRLGYYNKDKRMSLTWMQMMWEVEEIKRLLLRFIGFGVKH